jgi:hypothetical protein
MLWALLKVVRLLSRQKVALVVLLAFMHGAGGKEVGAATGARAAL